MNVLDLFSGIGGFSLGLERAGMRTVSFCEIDKRCQAILKRHWPNVPCWPDIRNLTASVLEQNDIWPDVICGGFPCQDISDAGLRVGIEGGRSGLWKEYARLVGAIRPRYVIVENVAGLLGRGMGDVLGDLATLGYDAEWHCIPASAVGSPQHRDRVWIISYPAGSQEGGTFARYCASEIGEGWANPAPSSGRYAGLHGWGNWDTEPAVRRVVNGLSEAVDEVASLGNAVVPQIPEIIGRAIMCLQNTSGAKHEG